MKKSGEAVIGDAAEYEVMKDQLQEALGGNAILVKNGQIYQTPQTGADKEPRTAVGIKADGDVFFVVIDGRQEPYSSGISMPDLAQLMIDLGAVNALNLDGGGSSTFTTRELGGDTLEIDNKPSDRTERSVANSWLIVSKEPLTINSILHISNLMINPLRLAQRFNSVQKEETNRWHQLHCQLPV